jgi:glyoxylase-like metal-dependent hydrolase (beta-lactamase superfamily II)
MISSTPLVKLADHVWIWPFHPDADRVQAAIGIVTGGNGTVLVDAGNSPNLARQVLATLAEISAPPIRCIVYTHHHWDHIFGAYMYDAPVVAHEKSLSFLTEMSQKPWGTEALRRHERNPDLKVDYTAEDWAQFRIVLPDVVFFQTKTIDLDGVTLQLEHVGGAHAADSIIIKVVEAGVMFLGDCYYPPNHTSDPISTAMLASLSDEAYQIYVDGHSNPFGKARLDRIVRLYGRLSRA